MKQQSERGAVLKALRHEAGLSQLKVAAAVGLDTKTISLLELGKKASISKKSAEVLSKFYSEKLGRTIAPADLGYQIGRNNQEKSGNK